MDVVLSGYAPFGEDDHRGCPRCRLDVSPDHADGEGRVGGQAVLVLFSLASTIAPVGGVLHGKWGTVPDGAWRDK